MHILGSSTFGTEKRQPLDYYATDPKAIEAFLKQFYTDGECVDPKNVWEPACGDGNLLPELSKKSLNVRASDIYMYGSNEVFDFLSSDTVWDGDIVTNPPYKLAEDFIRTALRILPTGKKLILLLRIQFLESSRRLELFKSNPPKFVYVHSSRIRIYKDNDQTKYTSTQPLCYAWFVWEKGSYTEPTIRWIP